MKRVLLFVFLAACRTKSNEVADANVADAPATPVTSASAGEDEEEEAALALADGGACPRSIHPDYCRFTCRTFASRQASKHARRMAHSERVAFGKCGSMDVFAEDEQAGDAGLGSGIVEYFENGGLVGATDSRAKSCTQFGKVPTCTLQLVWEESRAFGVHFVNVDSSPGGIPPEVISRIVRQNVGRYKLCATNAKERPAGRFAAKLHIAKDGSVSSVENDGSTMKGEIATCLTRAMQGLSFPQPEKGAMTATVALELTH